MGLDEEEEPMPKDVTLAQRLSLVERDARGHARALTNLTLRYGDYEQRLSVIEAWRQDRMIDDARADERDKALYGRLDRIEAGLGKMNNGISRALWIVAGTVIPAALVAIAIVLVIGAGLVTIS